MIRCLIVDDEEIARQHLVRLLTAYPDLEITGQASNGLEALEAISENQPDVVFLDVEMPGLTAFDMLVQVSHPPLIVFATAYDKYAVNAFEANAIDYLLKPVEAARLAKAIERIRAALGKPREDYESLLRRAISVLRAGSAPTKLAARRGKRIILLSPRDILYASIEDKIAFFHTQNERFATDRTMTELEELLSPAGFCRISRSVIANLTHARELLPYSSGTWRLKLSNNTELDVSRERARELKSRIR
jgi:two-component system LytT family response regulator